MRKTDSQYVFAGRASRAVHIIMLPWVVLISLSLMVFQANAREAHERVLWYDLETWNSTAGKVRTSRVDHADWRAITLYPNAAVSYRLPPKAFVRLYSDTSNLHGQLSVSLGDGHGLFSEVTPMAVAEQHYLLPPWRDASQLQLKNVSSEPVSISVLVSEPSPEKPFTRKTSLLSPEQHESMPVTTPHLNAKDQFWFVSPQQSLQYELNGPAFIEIESMLLLTDHTETLPSYQLNALLDDLPLSGWQHQAAVAPFYRSIAVSDELSTSDKEWLRQLPSTSTGLNQSELPQETVNRVQTTYSESHYLAIPEGRHRLAFRSLRPVLLRVFARENWGLASNAAFLYPSEAENQQGRLAYQDRLQQVVESIRQEAPHADLSILNAWLAQAHPIERLSERIISRAHFFRALPASGTDTRLSFKAVQPFLPAYSLEDQHDYGDAWINTDASTREDSREHSLPGSVEPQPAQTKPAVEQYLASARGQTFRFAVPPLETDSQLRMRVLSESTAPAQFIIRFSEDEQRPVYFQPEMRDARFWQVDKTDAEHQVSARFAQPEGSQGISQVYLALPKQVSTFSVTQVSGEPMALQLAYAVASQRTLSEPERASLIALQQADASLLGATTTQDQNLTKASPFDFLVLPAFAELRQRIRVRAQQFQAEQPDFPELPQHRKAPHQWRQQLEQLSQRADWAAALELVGPLTKHSDPGIRTDATLLRAELLLKAGEPTLYEHYLLEIYGRAKKQTEALKLARYAEDSLLAWYTAQERWLDLERFSASLFYETGDPAYLKAFNQGLIGMRQYELSEQLVRLLGQQGVNSQPAWQRYVPDAISSPETLLLYSHELDAFSQRFTASAQHPLSFKVHGPARIEFRVRPVISAQQTHAEDSWLKLRHNEQDGYLPVYRSPRAEAFSIVGAHQQALGGEQVHELRLGKGLHDIEISPEQGAVAIDFSEFLGAFPEGLPSSGSSVQQIMQTESDRVLAGHHAAQEISLEDGSAFWQLARLAPEQALLQLLWQAEHQATPDISLIAAGNSILQQLEPSETTKRLGYRLNRSVDWQLEDQIIESAGLRYIEFTKQPLISSAARIRQSLLPALDDASQWLSASRDLGLTIATTRKTALRLGLKQLVSPTHHTEPARVNVWFNDRLIHQLTLEADNQFHYHRLNVPVGEHALRVELLESQSDPRVVLRAEQLAEDGRRWQALNWPVRRSYYVSSVEQPVKLFVQANQWLRIDEFRPNEGTLSRYHYQARHGMLSLPPLNKAKESLLRIYSLVPAPPEPALPKVPALTTIQTPKQPLSPAMPWEPAAWQLEDNLELGEQNEGTWGAYMTVMDRALSDDESFTRQNAQHYLQLGQQYRRHDPEARTYWLSDTYIRKLGSDGQTLGTEQQFVYLEPFNVWQFGVSAQAQYFMASAPATDNLFAVNMEAEYQHNWRYDRNQSLDLSALVFGRFWSDRDPLGAARIDPSVFSNYKRDHAYGAKLSGNWRYRLWQDGQTRIGARLITNEALYSADQLALVAAYQHYWQGVTGQLSARHSWRFNDQDRQELSQQDTLSANLRWRAWQANGNEWYVGVGLAQDLTDSETTLALTLGFNHSDGRGMTDYLPDELAFRDLYRQQSFVQQSLNRIQPAGLIEKGVEHE